LNLFDGLPATKLIIHPDAQIVSISRSVLNGSKFKEITFPYAYQYANRFLFEYCPTITSLNYTGPVRTIQGFAFAGCSQLTQIYIEGRTVLYRETLNLRRTSVRDLESNSFNDVYFVHIILPREIVDPWSFEFTNNTFIRIIDIESPILYLTLGMFSGYTSLTTVYHDG
jgi:hypothetical protein